MDWLKMINTIKLYRLSKWLCNKDYKSLSNKVDTLNKILNKCVLHGETKICDNFTLGYGGIGVVIHRHATIGKNCTISQNVTIGRKKGKNDGVPVLGDNVYVGANTVIFGDIVVGDNCIIGPCTLVNKSIPSNSIVAGNPFKVIKKITKENYKEYLPYNIDNEKL